MTSIGLDYSVYQNCLSAWHLALESASDSEQCLPTGSLCLYICIYIFTSTFPDSDWNCFILLFYSAFFQWYAMDGILGTRTIVSFAVNSKASQEDEEGMGTTFPWLYHVPQKPFLGQNKLEKGEHRAVTVLSTCLVKFSPLRMIHADLENVTEMDMSVTRLLLCLAKSWQTLS